MKNKSYGGIQKLILIFSVLSVNLLFAQSYNMSNTPITTCSGNWYDSGGPSGNYDDWTSYTQTFTSSNGNTLQFNFTAFYTSWVTDQLFIYDGPNSTYPLIGTYSYQNSPGTITSSGTTLTFVFAPNSGGSSWTGWAATISCGAPPLVPYSMVDGSTVTACSGAFFDDGGSTAAYSHNQNKTMTFCSGTTDMLEFTFNNIGTALETGDTLFAYDGASTSAPLIGVYVKYSFVEKIQSSGTCMTFRFKSDASLNAVGWQSTFKCVSTAPDATAYSMSSGVRYVCSGSFADDGGAGSAYNDYNGHTQTYVSATGKTLVFNFSFFETNYWNDVLYIYDGPSASYPLIGAYHTLNSPGVVTSSGTALTFVFAPNGGGTPGGGWLASISCGNTPATVYPMSTSTITACSGIFTDDGIQTGNYSDNQNRIMTFCSGNSNMLEFTFNNLATALAAGDSLFIYDGASVASNPIAVHVAGSFMEKVQSSGTCLTFRFKSNVAGNAAGWFATFKCVTTPASAAVFPMSEGVRYVCSGTFYDDGGVSGNYNDFALHTQTFTSSNGSRLTIAFSSFNTSWVSDQLFVYDGPTTSYPLIGIFSYLNSPGTITSTGTSLTFMFGPNSGGSSAAGWAASISCGTPALTNYSMLNGATVTACSGAFYDDGGPTSAYNHNQNKTMTFCSGTSDMLEFTFNNIGTALETGDTLFAYDGATTSAPLIGVYVKYSFVEKIQSSGTCMTFRFKSDASLNAVGWQSTFKCVSTAPAATAYSMSSGIRYVCSGSFADDGGAGSAYNDYNGHTQTYVSATGKTLVFNFSFFETNFSNDVLFIYDGPSTSYPLIGSYHTWNSPGIITSSGTALTFVFAPNGGGTPGGGWLASISCGNTPANVYPMSSSTVTACSGIFTDDGNQVGNYTDNQNRIMTFCSGNGNMLEFTFNNLATALAAGDSLFMYDGASVASNPIAVHVAGSFIEKVQSTGTCLTFRFKSNAAGNAAGWFATFKCVTTPASAAVFSMSEGVRYVCSGTFYDDGGLSGNYNDFVSHTQTFVSSSGCGIRVTFNSFNTSTASDILRVYDGMSAAAPLLGTYTVNANGVVIQSSGNALTFVFNPNSLNSTTSGWNATFDCPTVTTTPIASSNGPVCEGGNLNLTATLVSNASYQWSGPNGFTSTQQNPVISSVTTVASGQYSVVAKIGTCASSQAVVNVVVNPALTLPIASSNTPVCEGGDLQLSVSSEPGATYSWTGPNGFTSTQQNPVVSNVSVNATGVYFVTVTKGPCSANNLAIVTISARPATAAAGNNGPICQGSNLNLTASAVNGATYSWSGPNGFISNDQNPVILSALPVNSGVYSVVTTVGNCSSFASTTNAVVEALPSVSASSNTPVCEGSTIQLTSSFISGANYSWTGPSGFTSVLQNPVVTANASASGTYEVLITKGACMGSATTDVTVYATPAKPLVMLSPDGLTISSSNSSLYQWFRNGVSISGAVTQSYTPSQSGDYTVEITTANGCTSSSDPFSFILNSLIQYDAADISIYPNPTTEILNFEFGDVKECSYEISIVDDMGQLCYSEQIAQKQYSLNLSELRNGIYHVVISNDEYILFSESIIKTNK